MKTKFTWIGIITILILGISIFFVGCKDDELNSVVQYHGQVVYINTTNPFPDITVKVTDGKNTHCQTQTDAGGMFKLLVHVDEIDGNYYLQAGDSTCIPKKVNLGGYGQEEVDLGVIEVEGPALPTVKTQPIIEVTAESATLGGIVETDGRLAVTARGICYSTEQHPSVDKTHTTDGSGLGEFTSNLKNLEHNTIYYARAYATNRMGTAYGEQVKFTTELGVPVVITDSVYRVTVNSARCKGHVESDGGYSVTQRGTCWSKLPDPTLDDDFTSDGSGIGEFTSALNNLQENTTYYVRSYATNSMSTVYGEQKKITTLDGLATVITTNSTTTATSMVINCEVTDDSGYTVTERGICYSAINSEPSIDDSKKANGKGKGTYSVSVSELTASTIYYVRAYAINEYGVAYSSTLYVTTLDGVASISILSIDNVTALTALCNIKVTDTNGGILKSCGLCWSTNSAPTIADSKTEAWGSLLNTTYQCNMSGLTPNTTYYVRGFATTDVTTAYGEQTSFTTKDGLPKIDIIPIGDNLTESTILTGGHISDNGGFPIIKRGVCWSTFPYPTINDSHTDDGTGEGYFSSKIENADTLKNTYIRAYAINEIGISYSEQEVISYEKWEYIKWPTISYGGYTYRLSRNLGQMDYNTALSVCSTLELAGYTDWEIPTRELLIEFMKIYREGWGFKVVNKEDNMCVSSGVIFYHSISATSNGDSCPKYEIIKLEPDREVALESSPYIMSRMSCGGKYVGLKWYISKVGACSSGGTHYDHSVIGSKYLLLSEPSYVRLVRKVH